MKKNQAFVFSILASILIAANTLLAREEEKFPHKYMCAQTYKGKAWHDSVQVIPGRIQCELYDEGGNGIAYKDSDTLNNGSGKLNPDHTVENDNMNYDYLEFTPMN